MLRTIPAQFKNKAKAFIAQVGKGKSVTYNRTWCPMCNDYAIARTSRHEHGSLTTIQCLDDNCDYREFYSTDNDSTLN